MTGYNKKLIEVALPLDAISKASARDKSIRCGHPGTPHLWRARRILGAPRAMIIAWIRGREATWQPYLSDGVRPRRSAGSNRWVRA